MFFDVPFMKKQMEHIQNKWNKWNKRSAAATFFTCKTRGNVAQPHTRQNCACFCCNPAGEHAVRSNIVPPPDRGGILPRAMNLM